jgi:hypothetical protein
MGETWTTYKLADGEQIAGEYSWVDSDIEEWIDPGELDEPVEVIKETWWLLASEIITIKPTDWCDVCERVCLDGEHIAGKEQW